MKRIIFTCFCLLSLTTIAQTPTAGMMYIKDKKFYIDDKKFFVKAMNFGVDIIRETSGDFYVGPDYSFGILSDAEEYTNANDAKDLLRSELLKVKAMGFNTIRLVGFAPWLMLEENVACENLTKIGIHIRDKSQSWDPPFPRLTPIVEGSTTHINYTFLFPLIKTVLDICAEPNINLKVILLSSQVSTTRCNTIIKTFNDSYLMDLAKEFKNNTTLIAYDLENEPNLLDNVTKVYKEDVCKISNDYYDFVKMYDPNHLITYGVSIYPSSIYFMWTPDVIHADFIAWHLYARIKVESNFINKNPATDGRVLTGFVAENHNTTLAINQITRILNWLKYNCTLPWMVGEIGFSGSDEYADGEGNANEQKIFAEQVLPKIVSAGSNGYAWWYWHDLLPDPNHIEKDYSLFYYGVKDNSDNDKPVADVFESFNAQDIAHVSGDLYLSPDDYYDPLKLRTYSPPLEYIEGYVKDIKTNTGIKDAYISIWDVNEMNTDPLVDDNDLWYNATTGITEDNGHFKLYRNIFVNGFYEDLSHNFFFPQAVTILHHYTASATGYNVLDAQTNYASLTNKTMADITLTPLVKYNTTISTEWIVDGIELRKAQNKFISDYIITNSGASLTVEAGESIQLKPETHLKPGSEVHLVIKNSFINDCEHLYNSASKSGDYTSQQTTIFSKPNDPKDDTTLMDIYKIKRKYDFKLFPNPNTGLFTVYYSNTLNETCIISINDIYGRSLYNKTQTGEFVNINKSELSNGTYFLTIKISKKCIKHKFVICK